jgi:ferredoxin--NADP+ reductase
MGNSGDLLATAIQQLTVYASSHIFRLYTNKIPAWSCPMSALFEEEVLSVHHWTDRLFSFRTTRSPSFRFENGQFTMIGLPVGGKPLLRAYSVVSPNYADELEFLSIKVPDGPLTSRLRHIKAGDKILVGRKPTGTLLIDNLLPGRNLYLLATGTGLAPFMSLVKDPAVYERFEKVVLVHGCRFAAELAYKGDIENRLPQDELLGEEIRAKLLYYPTVTREDFRHRGRITKLLGEGRIAADLGLPPIDAVQDRVMICGSPAFLADITQLLSSLSFSEGSSSEPGSYVIEKAFVER